MPLSRSHLDPDRSSAQEQNRAPPLIRRCNVLGVGVSAINPSVALETIGKWIDYRQAQWVTMSLLRLLQFRLEACGEVGWWFRPPWNKDKDCPSVLDAERLMRRHRAKIQRLLSKWAGDEGKTEEAAA